MHKNSLDNLKKGTKFTSEHQPSSNGRKKSKLKGMIEVNDLSSNDVSDLILSMMDKTKDELVVIAGDESNPFLVRAFVKAMIKDIDGDSLYNINSLLDRAVGKAVNKEEIKHTTIGEDGKPTGINISFVRKDKSNTN